ncbi:MAG: DEAD/DEAH box helicase [Planctomycetia bacterium]|nr:DEAD/DEAH box helicase [Planctomycetia bacterium]
MTAPAFSRTELADRYLAQLPYTPYPVQEEALLTWFTADQGVLVCAPTGTGKTLIAEAALYEALHNGTVAYYTTPLIALTEQKFREMQARAVQWGFQPDDVGLVTGNRRVNPNARILVVVAEILLNRLLHAEAFDFSHVSAVVMDEFHSFADPERGIVWELALSMLPAHIRLLLLSATVGNSMEFINWLDRCHGRKVEPVEGKERKVPLTYVWVPDQLLGDHLVDMAKGDAETRKTPALLFCFNRDECWSVAEMLKGLSLVGEDQRGELHKEVNKIEWAQGVGPKIKQMLHRGVGVHHAGMLGKYRRVVEELFNRKLLSVCVCTETLAAGINLPARSVVLTSLVKGPFGKEKLIDPSSAHQIFGRAGRPQFDNRGYVYVLAHEDDVRILRWKLKYDQIPEDTKDPGLLKAKKELKRKKPSRRDGVKYWTEFEFKGLQGAPPGKLYSKGPLPWRLLAYLLKISPEISKIRNVIRKRLMDEPRILAGLKHLDQMLLSLAKGGFVRLEPEPPPPEEKPAVPDAPPETKQVARGLNLPGLQPAKAQAPGRDPQAPPPPVPRYSPELAHPLPALDQLLVFRSVHPLYGSFLVNQLGIADRDERIQALESVLEMPRPLLKYVRVPFPDQLPPGPLATTRLDNELIQRGLMLAPVPPSEDDEEEEDDWRKEEVRPPTVAEKLRLYFDALYPDVDDVNTQAVWAAGELLRYEGNFNLYVKARDLVKQEGIIFRHLLRFILLLGEFAQVCPQDVTPEDWQKELRGLADQLTESCRAVDPNSTDEVIEQAQTAVDVVKGETPT